MLSYLCAKLAQTTTNFLLCLIAVDFSPDRGGRILYRLHTEQGFGLVRNASRLAKTDCIPCNNKLYTHVIVIFCVKRWERVTVLINLYMSN